MDSDDYLSIYMLEIMVKALEDSKTDMVCCKDYTFKDGETPEQKEIKNYHNMKIESNEEFATHFLEPFGGPIGWAWNKLYRRETIGDLRFLVGHVCEDNLFNADVIANGANCAWISDKLYFYRLRDGSITTKKKAFYYEDSIFVLKHQRDVFLNKFSKDFLEQHLCFILNKIALTETEAYYAGYYDAAKYIDQQFCRLYDENRREIRSFKEVLKTSLFRYARPIYHHIKKKSVIGMIVTPKENL